MRFLNFDEQLIPLDGWIQTFVDWLVVNYRDFFQIKKSHYLFFTTHMNSQKLK